MTKKKIIATLIAAVIMFCMMSVSTFAVTKTIYLPANQVWTNKDDGEISRGGSISFVQARLDSVYPISGSDNFTKIQVRVVNASGNPIMNYQRHGDFERLTEGSGFKEIYLKEGSLDYKTVYFQFRGNTDKAAHAVVTYYGN